MKPTPDKIAGALRAIIPGLVGYAGGRGYDLSWLMNPDVIFALATLGCVAWSVQSKQKPKPKLTLAEQPKVNQ